MATIELYAGKTNLMFDKFDSMRNSVNDFKTTSESFQKHLKVFDSNIYNTYAIECDIQTSIDTQQTELDSMDSLIAQIEEFIDLVLSTDESVAEAINQSKNDFYEDYSYLRPDSEKSGWEKFWGKTGKWCKEHWKLVVTIVLVIAAVVVIAIATFGTAGAIGPLLLLAAQSTLMGAAVGGIVGGTMSAVFGGSFFEGFESGAFGGAISGLLSLGFGTLIGGGVGATLSLGQTVFVGGLSEAITSLVSDGGDKLIKGDDMSLKTIMYNAGLSGAVGIIGSFFSYKLENKFSTKRIYGINKGKDSWSYFYHYQLARSLRDQTKLGIKATLKGYGSNIVTDTWSYLIEIPKGLVNEMIPECN